MVATASADVLAVEHELFRGQADLAGFLVELLGARDVLRPGRSGMHVHLDHPGIWGDGEMFQSRIRRRQVAFQHHLVPQFLRGGLDGGHQAEPILGLVERRQEDMQLAVAGFDGQRGADHAGGFAGIRQSLRHRREADIKARRDGARAWPVQRGVDRRGRSEGGTRREWIRFDVVFERFRLDPGQAFQWQAQADR